MKGLKHYKKALAYSMHKWDPVTMTPKHSGDSVQDCIDYVREKMYLEKLKTGNEEEILDDESNDVNDVAVISKDSGDNVNDDIMAENTEKGIEDETAAAEKETHGINKKSDSSSDSEISIVIPDDYLFPSYFVFVLWGPYTNINKRLNINVTDDKDKSKSGGSRVQQRKKDLEEKNRCI